MWKNLNRQDYEILYARYLNHSLLSVFDIDLNEKCVLDLCAGNGRLSLESLKKGASRIFSVDKNRDMIPPEIMVNFCKICYSVGDVQHYISHIDDSFFDVIFCQQAINYWFNSFLAGEVCRILKPMGLFIFNTFNKKPPEKPLIKKYCLGRRDYVEFSWLCEGVVHHLQVCTNSNIDPHYNTFRWISPSIFREILKPRFKIGLVKKGPSSYYKCVKK